MSRTQHLHPTLQAEQQFIMRGLTRIAGLDEAGRGAWAGPVVAAAVILPIEDLARLELLHDVRDSKQCTPAQREALYEKIQNIAIAVGTGLIPPQRIDTVGIVQATREAMLAAIEQLHIPPEALLIDALPLPEIALPQQALIHGDALSLSIAAASIIAKVTRDHWMISADTDYPGYGFAQHKGYGTRKHRLALARLGPSPLHRRSYAPIAELISSAQHTTVEAQDDGPPNALRESNI